MIRRAPLCLLAVILLFSACAPETPEEPAVSASATESLTDPETDELTDPPATEEVTDELTETPVTEELTSPETDAVTEPPLSSLPADELLLLSVSLTSSYTSYSRRTLTSLTIDLLGSETFSQTDSELRVSGTNAVFRRGGKDGFETLCLSDGELYRETELGLCRIGGYTREGFVSMVSDDALILAFTGGSLTEEGEDLLLSFSELTEEGRGVIVDMLGLPAAYTVNVTESSLSLRTDREANMLSSVVKIELEVLSEGTSVMSVSLRTDTEQSEIGKALTLSLPAREDYVYFKDEATLSAYAALLPQIAGFTSSSDKFEYSVSDDMLIATGTSRLPLTSRTVYAFNKRIGASIEKAFDVGDGTGKHTTLTHFNNRRGFSQIDGGSIFVDTTVNANNLAFTLSYPFTTSFFSFDSCTGTVDALTDGSTLALGLKESEAKSIAESILLRIGLSASTAKLGEYEAYTFIKLDGDSLSAIGYEFSAKLELGGKVYELERRVELEIISRDSANVKVIYIEVEDDE